ncbi:helix-turn-helix transcriptional regulator [Phaeacidiphilus oryzae]|uniref:helix-turn-helix transcriptional regulator n=1 Tax=Phaeacidiphilus oryzae TaxID=348818 RepID=UPI0005600ABA|nr:helix-turn-helix domain-containing protein [Phaeacidiphilus oryzae]
MAVTSAELPTRYLTAEEVAELLGDIPVQTLYQWRRKRTGPPAFRVGRHLRYDPADLQQWIAGLKAADTGEVA